MSRIDAKVVLLGKSYAGKTCLVNRYTRETFDSNIPYQNTIGAAFGSKKEIINGKPITLGIWDTAGHERYESMTRMYYRGAAACILCYDLTDRTSFDRVRFWAGELKSTEQNCKIYLCGTKKDICDDNPNLREVQMSTAEPLATDLQAELYETSSKTGENIATLFKQIAKDILQKLEAEKLKHRNDLQAELYETSSKTGENIATLFKQIAKDILQKLETEKLKHRNEQDTDSTVHIDSPRGISRCIRC